MKAQMTLGESQIHPKLTVTVHFIRLLFLHVYVCIECVQCMGALCMLRDVTFSSIPLRFTEVDFNWTWSSQ